MISDEFSPYEYFNKVIDLWWLVALATFLGGIFGFIFHRLQPPEYEATASYIVTIDLNRFPFQDVREDFIQYNEDLAVNITQDALLSQEVRDMVIGKMKEMGITISPNDLIDNSTIERKQELWELRYRSKDPQQAQEIVDTWAKLGYDAMLTWQESGKAPDYVMFNPPIFSDIPRQPVAYDRNKLILAGALFGFIVGIITASLISRPKKKSFQETT
jgi:uncharacterized protein involved in exopolysaccharide biosynthesis